MLSPVGTALLQKARRPRRTKARAWGSSVSSDHSGIHRSGGNSLSKGRFFVTAIAADEKPNRTAVVAITKVRKDERIDLLPRRSTPMAYKWGRGEGLGYCRE